MDYTKVPRELIYKDLDHLEDFNIGNRYSLNGQLYNMVRRYLFVEMGRNDYRTILLYILNEAYYLTTMLLMDDNADNDDVFNVYIKSILKDSPYPDEISSILRRLTMAICYINLERPSTESLKVRTIRRHLRNHAFEFIYLNSEISDYEHPDSKLFKPVALTEELLEQVKWRDLTDNFRPEIIKDFLATRNSFQPLWGILFRRELLEGCLDFTRDIIIGEDIMTHIRVLVKQPRVFCASHCSYVYVQGLPNTRKRPLGHEMKYDEVLRASLQPLWSELEPWFVRRQLKTYEVFIDERQFNVYKDYYHQLRGHLGRHIPLLDRIAFALPPRLAYIPVHIYKRLRRIGSKQIMEYS